MPSLKSLPFDVFLLISRHLDRSDLLNLLSTCTHLLSLLFPLLSRELCLESWNSLHTLFPEFLIDGDTRGGIAFVQALNDRNCALPSVQLQPYLRPLDLTSIRTIRICKSSPKGEWHCNDALAKLLSLCPNAHSLELCLTGSSGPFSLFRGMDQITSLTVHSRPRLPELMPIQPFYIEDIQQFKSLSYLSIDSFMLHGREYSQVSCLSAINSLHLYNVTWEYPTSLLIFKSLDDLHLVYSKNPGPLPRTFLLSERFKHFLSTVHPTIHSLFLYINTDFAFQPPWILTNQHSSPIKIRFLSITSNIVTKIHPPCLLDVKQITNSLSADL
ncbi:hypothetical protein CANCADRAFT_2655 [Tortispora caseinolytica NRRL Y-17796]|uniref:F-box domain-containing protein n=1 Tax=Tortispora caseinolytica NRRL Y-17796 TaxID=767744 RepID=A0A1E4TGV6_9ASCO|nr:hypothetical protein CANCADRAFT_2655 [Tortispora caseinolytica NRRL Y-17796]